MLLTTGNKISDTKKLRKRRGNCLPWLEVWRSAGLGWVGGLGGFLGPTLRPQLQAVHPSPATHGHRKSTSVREHTKSLSEAEKRRHKKTFSLIDCLFNWDGASLCQEPHQQACSVPHWSPRGCVPGPGAVVGLRDLLQSSVPWEADVTGSLIPPSTKPSCF